MLWFSLIIVGQMHTDMIKGKSFGHIEHFQFALAGRVDAVFDDLRTGIDKTFCIGGYVRLSPLNWTLSMVRMDSVLLPK